MRSRMHLIFAVVAFLFANAVNAAPYYRFWQGWKLESVSYDDFEKALDEKFIPATVEVGAGKGLIAYIPVLPPLPENRPEEVKDLLPDEIALVVYDSETNYRTLRSTPEGIAYGDLHWEYFDKERGSKSSLPEKYEGKLEIAHAYDVLEGNMQWQEGFVVYAISQKKADAAPYVNAMKDIFAQLGLASYLVLVEQDYVIEFQLWKDAATYGASRSAVDEVRADYLAPIKGASGRARKSGPKCSGIYYGEGVNTSFDF